MQKNTYCKNETSNNDSKIENKGLLYTSPHLCQQFGIPLDISLLQREKISAG